MDDLISRNKLQQNRPEWLNENCVGREEHNKGWNACNEMWLKTIAEQPTVEAKKLRVSGTALRCPTCNRCVSSVDRKKPQIHYCERCGQKFDWEVNIN